jgi:hypothetical protein
MDFFRIVDTQALAPSSALRVLVELTVVAVCAVALGVCLRLVPEMLVPHSKPTRPTTSVVRPVTHTAQAPPAAAATPLRQAATAPAVSAAPPVASKADHTLDDVLDSFFEDEDLLEAALLDTTAPVTAPVTVASKPHPSTAKAAAPPAPSKGDVFSKELAAKMTKNLQGKTSVAPPTTPQKPAAPAPQKATDAAATADEKLDDALDAYLAEEQLLDEAILDSAVQEAQH